VWWLVGILGVLVAWGLRSAHALLTPERRAIPPPHPLPHFSRHQLTAPDGPFELWLLEPRAAPRGLVFLCHGYYANRYQVLGIAECLRGRGYAVTLFDLRGHGERTGRSTLGWRDADDALLALDWARARYGERIPVAAMGLSLGASVACRAAARATGVQAVVLDSVYPRLFPIIQRGITERYRVPAWPLAWITWAAVQLALRAPLGEADPAALAPRMRQPLLAIHGGGDRRVPIAMGQEVFDRWGGPKERWTEPDVAHVGMFDRDPKRYCDRVGGFLDRALGAPA
jgi:alpha-beta hydrolase superfamily lysophospholipase